MNIRTVSPGGRRRNSGTITSITNAPPDQVRAALAKHATCASCVVRFMIVLRTR